MSVLNELLEYQKVDAELRKIEQEIAGSEERKKYVQAKKFIENAMQKLEAQDKRAVELRKSAQQLTARYKEIKETIAEYASLDEDTEDGGQISYYKRSAQALADNLRALKGDINKLVAEIESASEEYKKMKAQTLSVQKQSKEINENYKNMKNSRAEEVKKINDELDKIGAKIPSDVLEKYKTKRKERIFPILAPLTAEERCICGMDFSIAEKGKLAGGGVIECEHCRRLIYKS